MPRTAPMTAPVMPAWITKMIEGRNPRTGEPVEIAASRQVKFKPGKGLKDAVNG